MIFHHTWQEVLDGTKTQTRRVVKPSDDATIYEGQTDRVFTAITSPRSEWGPAICLHLHLKWQVGNYYAVQSGRGKKSVGCIRITRIGREPLQDITEEEARAEGCSAEIGAPEEGYPQYQCARDAFIRLWNSIQPKGQRWEDNPLVWVLEFELVEAAK